MSTEGVVSLLTTLNSCVKTCEEKAAEMLLMTEVPVGYMEALNNSCAAVADFEKTINNFVTALHMHPDNYDLHMKIGRICEVDHLIVLSTFRQLIKCW